MSKVSVDLDSPSPYIERETKLHRFKRRLTYAFAFRLLKKTMPQYCSGAMLEIGTGAGFFQKFFKEKYPHADQFGIEYDTRLLKETKARAPHSRCVQGNAEQFEYPEKKFDIIVSFQVIEHLYKPELMLERVKTHLSQGGVFLVTTPNLTGLGAKVMGRRWHGYRDDHVSLKGMDEWIQLIESMGFVKCYAGSTFFTGIPLMNRLPLGLLNWILLLLFGVCKWKHGESFVGVFKLNNTLGGEE